MIAIKPIVSLLRAKHRIVRFFSFAPFGLFVSFAAFFALYPHVNAFGAYQFFRPNMLPDASNFETVI